MEVKLFIFQKGKRMTITKYDGLAILPKRCDKCNRLFWLEPYNIFYKTVGIENYSLKQIECKNCICIKRRINNGKRSCKQRTLD